MGQSSTVIEEDRTYHPPTDETEPATVPANSDDESSSEPTSTPENIETEPANIPETNTVNLVEDVPAPNDDNSVII